MNEEEERVTRARIRLTDLLKEIDTDDLRVIFAELDRLREIANRCGVRFRGEERLTKEQRRIVQQFIDEMVRLNNLG